MLRRQAYFGPREGWLEAEIWTSRAALGSGRPGPLIVEEYDATLVIPPGAVASCDDAGNVQVGLP